MVMFTMHPTGNPDTRGWGPGWPSGQSRKIVPVVWSNGVSPAGGVRSEIATLVVLLGNEMIRRGYSPKAGWCWGYENRAITGTTDQPSLHSWGLAVDINAPTNPYHSTLITDMPSWMPPLWLTYGFRWGGTYPGNKDAMHYEFMGTPADAVVLTALALSTFKPHPLPTQPNGVPLVATDAEIQAISKATALAVLNFPIHHNGKPDVGFLQAFADLATDVAAIKAKVGL